MKIKYTDRFVGKLKKLYKEDRSLAREVDDVINTFRINPYYPGLRLHKLRNNLIGYWSFSVKDDLRILFYYRNGDVVLTDIGTHKDVYEVN